MIPVRNTLRIVACILGTLLLLTTEMATAFDSTRPAGLGLSMFIAPRVSAAGTSRTVSVHGASGPVMFDESSIATTGTLVIRMTTEIIGLAERPQVVNYTPRNAGSLRVILRLTDGTTTETQMETVERAHSTVNLDGMWFDPATNGSGISFHHSASSDVVFGTWFLYAGPKFPESYWYSLQSLQWLKGATSLTGIAYDAVASTQSPCIGDYCPRPAGLNPVGSVEVSVVDRNTLRVEAIDLYGRTAFVSSLKRLAF